MATEAKPSSFLAAVKQEVTDLFASAYDAISGDFGEEVPQVVGEEMKKLQKKTWEVMERRLKESYLNGKKAGGTNGKDRRPPADHDAPPTGSNPFRK